MKRVIFSIVLLFCVPAFSIDVFFQDTDIKDALVQLSQLSGVPILFSSKISGRVSLELYDVSLDTALNLLLSGTPYDWIKGDGYYLVFAPSDTEKLVFLPSAVINLQHVPAEQVVEFLGVYKDFVVPVGNTLIVFGGERVLRAVKEIAEKIDVEREQYIAWYRYVRISEEKTVTLKRLLSSKAVSVGDTYTVITDEDVLTVEDFIRVLSEEEMRTIASGVVPIEEGRETKISLQYNEKSIWLSLALSGNNIRISLKDSRTALETDVSLSSKKITIVDFEGGILELKVGKIAPVSIKEEKKDEEKDHTLTGRVEMGKSLTFLSGATARVVGNLELGLLAGVKDEEVFLSISLKDVHNIRGNIFSYGEFQLSMNKDAEVSQEFSLGIAWKEKVLFGLGVWSDFSKMRPEIRLAFGQDAGVEIIYVVTEKVIIGFWVRW